MQLQKVIRSREVVLYEAKLLKTNCTSLESRKRVKFQQQPTIDLRVTSQGDEQVEISRTVFLEFFAPLVKIATLMTLSIILTLLHLELYQMIDGFPSWNPR